jgi:putative hemolysin
MIFIEIGILFLLLLANGVFAMAEIAVVSSRKARLKQLADAGDHKAKAALALAESPNRFLATVQIGITLVGIVAGVFGGATLAEKLAVVLKGIPLVSNYAEPISFALVVTIITYFSLVIGELIPKRIGLGNPEGIARMLAGPMNKLAVITNPVVTFLSASTDSLLKVFGIKPQTEATISEEEVKLMAREGLRAGILRQSETEMVEGVLDLDRLPVREVMTPRNKIIWINITDSHENIWHKIVVSGHTRFPVYENTRDHIVGVLSVKALYANLAAGAGTRVRDLMTPTIVVPASQDSNTLLGTFKKSGKHMAMVSDEFGQIVGLVTIHDILEAIAGDFPDQRQRLRPTAKRRDDGSWLIDAMLDAEEFEKLVPEFKLCPIKDRDYQTFAGYVVQKIGHIPHEGESFEDQGFIIEIIDMDGHRVDKVLLIPKTSGILPERPNERR